MTEIKLYKSPWRALRMLLICSIFSFMGVMGLISGGMPTWISWLGIILFGLLGIPGSLFHLFDRRPQIIINEIGIYDRTTHKDFINWEIIQNAYLMEIHRQKFICLVVDDKFKPSKKKSKVYQQVARLSETIMGSQELNLSLGQIKIDAHKLTEFIIAMRTATRPNKEELLIKALSELK